MLADEAIEILRVYDDGTDEKIPKTHLVIGAYDGPIDARPDEKVVFRWRTATMNNTTVFTTKDYIRRTWGRFFEVVDIVTQSSMP